MVEVDVDAFELLLFQKVKRRPGQVGKTMRKRQNTCALREEREGARQRAAVTPNGVLDWTFTALQMQPLQKAPEE